MEKYVNMADINTTMADSEAAALVEMLFFAYRDFVADADATLAELNFGRAHHRVLHFVGRSPGMTVAQLLDILRITKQSLSLTDFPSKKALRDHLTAYMRAWKKNPTPFAWTKPAAAIIRSPRRMLDRISTTVH